MTYNYGEPDEFEVTWRTGHIDHFKAHQVSWPNFALFGDTPNGPKRVQFHASVNGHWKLILSALEDDILSIRNVTQLAQELP